MGCGIVTSKTARKRVNGAANTPDVRPPIGYFEQEDERLRKHPLPLYLPQ
jgi:hypothetical protein